MPKGHAVPNAVYGKVYELLLDDDTLSGKELKKAVQDAAKTDDALHGLDISERKYQQIKQEKLPEIKKMKAGPLEQPWSVMALPCHPIEAQALPIVLRIWEMQLEAHFEIREYEPDANPPVLTVRQALWISRLYRTVRCETETDLEVMCNRSNFFAKLERIFELRGGYNISSPTLFASWALADTFLKPSQIIQDGIRRDVGRYRGYKPVTDELRSLK